MRNLSLEELVGREQLAELRREAQRQHRVQAAVAAQQPGKTSLQGRLVASSGRALMGLGQRMLARGQHQQPDMPC